MFNIKLSDCVHVGCILIYIGSCRCGKTTVCQMFAEKQNKKLLSVNCHLHTESADFLGGLRPVRHYVDSEVY